MIVCDNPDCTIEWFHITCLQMKKLPKGKQNGSVQIAGCFKFAKGMFKLTIRIILFLIIAYAHLAIINVQ